MSSLPPTAGASRRGSFAEADSNKRSRGAQDDSAASPRGQDSSASPGSAEAQLAAMQQQLQQLYQQAQAAQQQQQLQQQQLQQQALQLASQQQQLQLAHASPASPAHQLQPPPAPLAPQPDALAGALAQALALNQPFALQPFNGEGNTAGLQANNWLRDTDVVFAERHALVGPLLTDARRIAAATSVLRGAAASWNSTRAATHTWAAFKAALLERFQPRNAALLLEKQLESFVAASEPHRDRKTAQQVEAYTAKFLELSNALPDTMLPPRARLRLYERGLPFRGREITAKADSDALAPTNAKPIDLSAVINLVLRRAAEREQIGAPPVHSDPMDLSRVALEQAQHAFDIDAALAQQYLAPAEGWSERDTSSSTAQGSSASIHTPTSHTAALEAQIAALSLQVNALSRDRSSAPMRESVPPALREARIAAGICVKCGVAPYSTGRHGHNARTCQAAVDLTTPVPRTAKSGGGGGARGKPRQDFQ